MRLVVLSLYRNMLRQAKQYKDYNFREYILRRVRTSFKNRKDETDPQIVEQYVRKARETLDMIQRQRVVDNMYTRGENIMEKIQMHP
eukprot:CAMPEP_0114514928 /NCGR_PEP_ID=MMETSP0109-20121206/16432_1 /TAXON_ID=29199 /ORGANISM="Chlorarachnion reptans, Strain CCCM449" /LENGTH=86 /DNA_ID=CAMNT_0001695035 /DNA_START=182 /DNA_END=442 /DNA_ORIENTATION=+